MLTVAIAAYQLHLDSMLTVCVFEDSFDAHIRVLRFVA